MTADDVSTIVPNRQVSDASSSDNIDLQVATSRFAFENELENSRVYNRTQIYNSDISFRTSAVRTHAWSVFSGVSLAEISIISAIALPLYSNDISNSKWYRFGEIAETGPHRVVPNFSRQLRLFKKIESPSTARTSDVAKAPNVSDIPIQVDTYVVEPNGQNKIKALALSEKLTLYKLVLTGDEGVGKSALVIQVSISQLVTEVN
jgi:hypothetical protein